ncbi:MAG TPA: hypothetical protein VGZ22_00770 [Isosphaeraceae bacterium]|jgi:hypothetical protein|nr:hypothetical protein [Isosphaeraceae bacterium]
MGRFRFSIANLLILVLSACAVAGALREPSDLWRSGLFSLTVALLLFSVLLALHHREQTRAFWLGFALCAGVYHVASLVRIVESRLVTTRALPLRYAHRPWAARPNLLRGEQLVDVTLAYDSSGQVLMRWPSAPNDEPESFRQIGHFLLTLLWPSWAATSPACSPTGGNDLYCRTAMIDRSGTG